MFRNQRRQPNIGCVLVVYEQGTTRYGKTPTQIPIKKDPILDPSGAEEGPVVMPLTRGQQDRMAGFNGPGLETTRIQGASAFGDVDDDKILEYSSLSCLTPLNEGVLLVHLIGHLGRILHCSEIGEAFHM